jgi:predicted RNA-binding protein with PIN domain
LVRVRAVVEGSAVFRARVADAAPTEAEAGGRAPWLFLHRPDGWEAELEALASSVEEAAAVGEADAAERRAQRQLRSVSEELGRLESEVVTLRARLAATEAELVDDRRGRRSAESSSAALQARVASLERERDAAHRRASAAETALAASTVVDHEVAVAGELAVDPGRPRIDEDAVRRGVASAASALSAMDDAVSSLRALLGDPDEVRPPSSSSSARRAARRAAAPVSGRRPAPLPPGIFDDDPAAADFLIRLPAAVLVVDGYNATLRRWPDLSITEQRRRLIDALSGATARTGVDVEVVFDGDEHAVEASTAWHRRGVRVTFSSGAVEADDVILDLVKLLPISRPVVVATDDRRVQREASERGANVISSGQLFAVLGLA